MAFVALNGGVLLRARRGVQTCRVRMTAEEADGNGTPTEPAQPAQPTPPVQQVSNDGPVPGRKLVRNVRDLPVTTNPIYAEAAPGDMGKSPEVGAGMGPRRGKAEKKVTRAAAIQKSQSFADAWAEQNQGRVDVWLIIGIVTLLTPLAILVWGVVSGASLLAAFFDQ